MIKGVCIGKLVVNLKKYNVVMDWFDNDRKLTNYFSKQANLQHFKLLIFNHVKL